MKYTTRDDFEFMDRASREWPKSSSSRKLECPDCGNTGYARGTWMLAHRQHRRCECGQVKTVRGIRQHQRYCGHHTSKEYP